MSDPEFNGAAAAPVEQASSVGPGAQLAARRQALGWSIEQVANQLNLAPRQIQAVEEDNYAALPGMVIARGFLRSYAKLLKIDPAPLVSMVAEDASAPVEAIEPKRALSASFSESSLPPMRRNSPSSKWRLFVLFLIILLAAGWMIYDKGWLPVFSPAAMKLGTSAPQSASASITEKAVPATPAISPNAAENPADSPASGAERIGENIPSTEKTENAANSVSSSPAPTDTRNAGASSDSKMPASKDSLVLTIREDSWIELKRANDKTVLVSRLMKAGSSESFEIGQPMLLTVGNAAGVDATLRGNPLDLKSSTKNNVVRLEVK